MEYIRKIVNLFPPELSLPIIGAKHFLSDYKNIISQWKRIIEYKRILVETNSYERNKAYIKRLFTYSLFNSFAGSDKYIISLIEGGELVPIHLSDNNRNIKKSDVIMICCVYNDLTRIKKVVEHHRAIGVQHMVFLDNASDDGTREWLESQEVDLYYTDEEYCAGTKGAWIRKIQTIYGFDRWYLIVDSDELFSYIGEETHSIAEVVCFAEKNNYLRVRSMMLDMYPNHKLYIENNIENDFTSEYCYYDKDSYIEATDGRGSMLRGGPRKRVFQRNLDFTEALGKYPLVFMSIDDIWVDHQPMPYYKNYRLPCLSVLRHYKFMSGDFEKYKKIVTKGNYVNESMTYKTYCMVGEDVSFFYEGSEKYESSYSLKKLSFVKEIKWNY